MHSSGSLSKKHKGLYPAYPADFISDVRDLFIKSTVRYPDKTAVLYPSILNRKYEKPPQQFQMAHVPNQWRFLWHGYYFRYE